MIKELIKIANELDERGLAAEADKVDSLIKSAVYSLGKEWIMEVASAKGTNSTIDIDALDSLVQELFSERDFPAGGRQEISIYNDILSAIQSQYNWPASWEMRPPNLEEAVNHFLEKRTAVINTFSESNDNMKSEPTLGPSLFEAIANSEGLGEQLRSVESTIRNLTDKIEGVARAYGNDPKIHMKDNQPLYPGPTLAVYFPAAVSGPEAFKKALEGLGLSVDEENSQPHYFTLKAKGETFDRFSEAFDV
jgi:hypothetical protein